MDASRYFEYMPVFKSSIGSIVRENDVKSTEIIKEWAQLIVNQHQKGLVPLFLSGSGVSAGAVPNLSEIVDQLKIYYDQGAHRQVPRDNDVPDLFSLLLGEGKKDRSIFARLLTIFQEKDELRNSEWKSINTWLFGKILRAAPQAFHKRLADLCERIDILCVTLNFDGLLIRELVQYRKRENAFSLPTKQECEGFFLRDSNKPGPLNDFLEIQVRGDIFYVVCNSQAYCPQRNKEYPLWSSVASFPEPSGGDQSAREQVYEVTERMLLRCPSCGDTRFSFLSFPGSYKKEGEMRDMLELIWKYCAFRIGSVTVTGISGEWDPLIVAFLGDLLSEREIPMLVVDKYPELIRSAVNEVQTTAFTYVVKELVKPGLHGSVCLEIDAGRFMEKLIDEFPMTYRERDEITFGEGEAEDRYWHALIGSIEDEDITASLDLQYSILENAIRKSLHKENLQKFAQLGIKSYWLGIYPPQSGKAGKYHNRFNHSVGVMKIASLLYDNAFANSNMRTNSNEKQFLRLAALLHDAGHLPFSHLIEDVFKELNWRPAGYSMKYSHVLQTDEKIRELFTPTLRDKLAESGYHVEDLVNLVNGRFGQPYLDAIINSPFDADKIDYVFRDADSTGRNISLSPIQFLRDVCEGIAVSPEKYLSLSKTASRACSQLLNARKYLYDSLYVQPAIVVLEGIVKLILKTYFVHCLRLNAQDVMGKMNFDGKDYPDLGDYKIHFCVNELLSLLAKAEGSEEGKQNLELGVIKIMYQAITKMDSILNRTFLDNLSLACRVIEATNNVDQLKKLEQKIVMREIGVVDDDIEWVGRDVTFRMPGAIVVALRRLPSFLSISEARQSRERSDGSKACAECILVPSGDYEVWNSTSKASTALQDSSLKGGRQRRTYAYLYPLSGDIDDSYFKQAVNLFDKMARKRGGSLQP